MQWIDMNRHHFGAADETDVIGSNFLSAILAATISDWLATPPAPNMLRNAVLEHSHSTITWEDS